MEREFIPYELALRMKQLGFDEPCMAAFEDNGKLFIYWNDLASKDELFCSQKVCEKLDYECLVPTWQQAFRWFREKHGIVFYLNMVSINLYYYVIGTEPFLSFKTYEEAELACITALINIVENKQQAKTK